MPDEKISDLPLTAGVNADDTFEKSSHNAAPSQRATAAQIASFVNGGVKVYRALLNQTGTDAPVATVLENSLGGAVVWSYLAVGNYRGTLAGAFTIGKAMVSGQIVTPADAPVSIAYMIANFNADVVEVHSIDGNAESDDVLINTPIEILVYP